jgi:hypothetical protein
MYQHGQGVKQNDAIAVAWYRFADDQGNTDGDNNLRNLCVDLEQRCDETCDKSAPVNDPALERIQRRADIRDLRTKIASLETDALQDEISANQLANIGTNSEHAQNNYIAIGIAKVQNSIGMVVGVPARVQAPALHQEATVLREKLAQLERLEQSSADVRAP